MPETQKGENASSKSARRAAKTSQPTLKRKTALAKGYRDVPHAHGLHIP